MLELRGICKRFGETDAVRAVNLTIPDGEFFALLGPSGCGKTTLLRMLGGFEDPSAGEIHYQGKRIDLLPANRRQFNMVFQRYALFPHLDVYENVAFGLRMKRVPETELKARVQEMLALVKMDALKARATPTLSGGQQQRVALARALVNRPRVLLLDEPLSALDLKLRQQMQVELRAIQRRLGHTFIFVTHDQEEALTLSDRIAVMNEGVVEQVGTPQEIYESPATAFVARFIGSINEWPARIRSRDRFGAAVEVPAGSLRVFEARPRNIPPNESVRMLIRPEKIRIGHIPGHNHIPGILREIVYLGAFTQYVVDSEIGPILIVEPNTSRSVLAAGEKIELSWAPEDSHLLGEGA